MPPFGGGFGRYPGGFGGMPGGGFPGGNAGGVAPSGGATPKLECTGPSGKPCNITIDTGANITVVSTRGFRRCFAGHVQLDSKSVNISGIGGASNSTQGRFTMVLTFDVGGRKVQLKGDAYIYPTEELLGCEILLGMPFNKGNGMSMRFNEGGRDSVRIAGEWYPIRMLLGPAGLMRGDGKGGMMFRLTGPDGKGV